MNYNLLTEDVKKRLAPILDHSALPALKDPWKRRTTAQVLYNTEQFLMNEYESMGGRLNENAIPANYMGASSSTAGAGGIDTFDPILINLLRRSTPNMISFDIMGVQPMTGPTGLIFALRSRYTNQTGAEAFYNEVNTAFGTVTAGANTQGDKHVGTLPGNSTSGTSNLASTGIYNYGDAMSRAQGEALGTDSNTAWPEMAFSIEKVSVEALTRALAAEYSMELAQDLKVVHGLDAEAELSNILSTELLAEINREALRTVLVTAKRGAASGTTTAGRFDLDVDANGRWSVERFKGLHFFIERECNLLAKETRRGKGNILICSADVASALNAAGKLSLPDLGNNLMVDDTGSTFAGVLNGRIKVYIDPYAIGGDYMVVGYKGQTPYDAGIFYCPYVPLQQVRAVYPGNFGPRIGFKTRYGMVANPYAEGLTKGSGALNKDSNVYYRRIMVDNLL